MAGGQEDMDREITLLAAPERNANDVLEQLGYQIDVWAAQLSDLLVSTLEMSPDAEEIDLPQVSPAILDYMLGPQGTQPGAFHTKRTIVRYLVEHDGVASRPQDPVSPFDTDLVTEAANAGQIRQLLRAAGYMGIRPLVASIQRVVDIV